MFCQNPGSLAVPKTNGNGIVGMKKLARKLGLATIFCYSVTVTRMSLAAVEGLEAVVGCEQGRWPEFIQVQKMVRMEAKMNEQKPKS